MALVPLLTSTGCTMVSGISRKFSSSECLDEMILSMRNRAYSAKAWYKVKHRYKCHRYVNDFCAGFRAGYEDVANGSDGCTPAIAPREYWSWRYQSPEGQAKVAAWFEGYPLGVKAAEQCGIGYWGQIQTTMPMNAGDGCPEGMDCGNKPQHDPSKPYLEGLPPGAVVISDEPVAGQPLMTTPGAPTPAPVQPMPAMKAMPESAPALPAAELSMPAATPAPRIDELKVSAPQLGLNLGAADAAQPLPAAESDAAGGLIRDEGLGGFFENLPNE